MLVSPSILSANFLSLESEITMLNESSATAIHCDIMDGVFVPNISFGFPVISAIKKKSTLPLDVHLMIVDADRYVEDFKHAGADWLSVHYEGALHLHRTIEKIKKCGMKAGVVLNPHTPVTVLSEILAIVDIVLLMSVNPGFGGQQFIDNTLNKIRQLKANITERNLATQISIDGGVTLENAGEISKAGADIVVVGNTVFKANHPTETIKQLTL